MFRRWLLILSLPLLILGLCLLRGYRFERLDNQLSVGMDELQSALPNLPEGASWELGKDGTILRVKALPGRPHVHITFRIPVSAPLEAIHTRLDFSCRNLVRGKQEWEDGRIFLRWLSDRENGLVDIDRVASVRGDERQDGISLVTQPSFGKGYPVLVIENLAASGEMSIAAVELTPVRHRAAWHWMRWVLVACWFSWFFACLSGFPKVAWPRRAAAASLWVVMGALFAFPGPWERIYPLLIPYDLGASVHTPAAPLAVKPAAPETKTPQGIASQGALGKIPEQGGWIMQLRSYLKNQRLLLHTGFVVGITLLFSYLVGTRRGTWLAGGLVLAIEGAQTGLGYGFDFVDFTDLICGAVGITVGWLLFWKLNRWSALSRWMALPASQPAAPSVADGAPNERKP